ncbi:hypothetical protein [Parasphingopyxis marina]|uniref:Uncharacterized protein n=1 Tax=Parasphingopyxis marina TaxID=2761622 RepID=A0A842HY01_9SPHN|nr:hypothetical protein [Parasphingopyxis marina]MBC2777976.1 hypothetical protein [Parasphingopyxis marina]
MSRKAHWILGILGVVIVATAAYFAAMSMGLGDYDGGIDEAAPESATDDLAAMSPGERLCSAQSTVDSIRQRIFSRARTTREDDGEMLSRLETGTVARIEGAHLVNFNESTEEARCEGRLVLELPRGTEPAFNYSRRLTAELDFVAQPTVGGRGMVSRMTGADMIIDRLADADLVARADSQEDELRFPDREKEEFDPELPDPEYYEPDPRLPELDGDSPENLLPPDMRRGGN